MEELFVAVSVVFALVLLVVLVCAYWLRKSFLKHFAISVGVLIFVSWLAGAFYAKLGRVMTVPNTIVLVGLYISVLLFFVRYVRRYINAIIEGLQRIAQGDLRYSTKDWVRASRNEFGTVGRGIDEMVAIVREPVQGIEQTCVQVESSSEQFQRQSERIAHGANDQAASAEEISSAMA